MGHCRVTCAVSPGFQAAGARGDGWMGQGHRYPSARLLRYQKSLPHSGPCQVEPLPSCVCEAAQEGRGRWRESRKGLPGGEAHSYHLPGLVTPPVREQGVGRKDQGGGRQIPSPETHSPTVQEGCSGPLLENDRNELPPLQERACAAHRTAGRADQPGCAGTDPEPLSGALP